ncbi:MAG: DegQ family serine endoprotease [Opitutaceae bacterium]
MNTSHSHSPNRRRALWTAGVLAVAGVFAGLNAAQNNSAPAISLKRDAQPVNRGQLERASFSDVVKRVSPSVVKITTQTKARRMAAGANGGSDFEQALPPGLREFFGGRMPEMRQAPQSGLGSGVIISADGYVVTNNHVVDNADTVTVALNDGREFTAKVVGRDPKTDIAVVKVDAKDLPAVTFADTAKIEVGDRVLAIGNPFDIGVTVTSGIVSATGRHVGILRDVQGYEDFIQTDAAINPGNSGGALVDIDGRLVGINTAILSRTGGFQGVGLAVPANLVSHVADSLVKNGKVVRGFLGVALQPVITPDLAESFGLKSREGALIAAVVEDSPAAKGGLKEGDVIVAVNGQPVTDANRLTLSISALSPGTKLTLDVIREGTKKQFTATTGEAPRKPGETERLQQDTDDGILNGVAVDDLDPQTRDQLNIPNRVKGALITQVDPESAAARVGIRRGDVILEIDGKPVTSAEQAVDVSGKVESKKARVRLWSRGGTLFVVVDESGSKKAGS